MTSRRRFSICSRAILSAPLRPWPETLDFSIFTDIARIGGVVWTRHRGESEQPRHHPAHLVLGGTPVAAHRGLDLLGGIGMRLDPALTGRQQLYQDHKWMLAFGEGL